MKYALRFILYLAIFWFTFSVSYVVMLGFVPVTITPLKFLKLSDNRKEYGLKVDSRWRSIDKIAVTMVQAVITSEDNNFMLHKGFDIDAIGKAIEYNKKGTKVRGASTISQQTAKNVFCTPSRTWTRKAIESYFTILIELFWSKERIMEVYLNIIETHPNVYGVESTARRFFDKNAARLTTADASMIACVLPNPRRMNLSKPSSYMQRRSATIRQLMRQLPKENYTLNPTIEKMKDNTKTKK